MGLKSGFFRLKFRHNHHHGNNKRNKKKKRGEKKSSVGVGHAPGKFFSYSVIRTIFFPHLLGRLCTSVVLCVHGRQRGEQMAASEKPEQTLDPDKIPSLLFSFLIEKRQLFTPKKNQFKKKKKFFFPPFIPKNFLFFFFF